MVARWLSISQGQLARIERSSGRIEDLGRLIQWAKIMQIPSDLLWFALPGEPLKIKESEKQQDESVNSVSSHPEEVPPETAGTFGEHLTNLMDEREVGIRELAKRTHFDPSHLSKIRASKRNPSPGMARELDSALGAKGQLTETAERTAKETAPRGTVFDDEDRIIQAMRRPSRVDETLIESFIKILAAQRQAEDSIGAVPLIKPVTAQLNAIESLCRAARGPIRPKVVDIAAQWAEFTGWLYTSTGNYSDAGTWFDRALEWSIESGNTTLSATSLSFKGHVAFLSGQAGPMIGLSRAAQRDSSVWVGQRAYDSFQEARGLAIIGDSKAAVRKIDEGAERAEIANGQDNERPPWIYYYTRNFFGLEQGLAYRFLGRDIPAFNEKAITSLTSALNEMDDGGSSEWAAEYMHHLAIAYMQADAPENACRTSRDILRIARFTESERLVKRLNGLHARFADRWPKESNVAELGELLRLHS
jgi:transcriptional regulator with XRE-family HTH domain